MNEPPNIWSIKGKYQNQNPEIRHKLLIRQENEEKIKVKVKNYINKWKQWKTTTQRLKIQDYIKTIDWMLNLEIKFKTITKDITKKKISRNKRQKMYDSKPR